MNTEFHLNGLTLETERLLLRPFRKTDLEDIYEYASAEGVMEMAGEQPHGSIEETDRNLELVISEDKVFAVVSKEDGKVIGSLTVETYGREELLPELTNLKRRELGFILSKTYWGKGLMPEAVNRVIAYLFEEEQTDVLLCAYFLSNLRSKRVQEKCGFKPYRQNTMKTPLGTEENEIVNILVNPNKIINFSDGAALWEM